MIGNVAAGSAFAVAQSLGASGTLAIAGSVGAGVAAAGALAKASSSKEDSDEDSEKIKEYHEKYFEDMADLESLNKVPDKPFRSQQMAKL